MKKLVFRLDLHDDRDKRKAMKLVSTLAGVDNITMDMKSKQLTVIGDVDPVCVLIKLRKFWPTTNIVLVGPAKEPEKKEEGKKEEAKKDIKFVFRLDFHDDKDKRKVMKLVSTRAGVDAITIDMKSKQLTVIGTVDPVRVASKLRKSWHTEIVLVGPANEPEKKEEGKKEEVKKDDEPKKEEDEPKEEEAEQEGEAKKEEPKKEGEKKKEPEPMIGFLPYQPYYRPVSTYYYYAHQSTEEKIHYTSSIKLEPYHIFNGTKENKKHMPTVNLLLHSSKHGGESKFVRCLLIS